MAKRDVYLLGQKRMNHVISHIDGVKRAVKNEADDIGNIARRRLNTEPKRRTGASQVVVSQGDTDAFVSLVDPAALSIEFGHYLGSEELGTARKFVPGLHIFIDWYHEGLV